MSGTDIGTETVPGAMDASAVEAVIDALPDLLFLLAPDGRVLRFRAGEARHLYSTPERMIGSMPEDLLPADVAAVFRSALERCKVSGKLESCEYRLPLETGPVWFEARLKATASGTQVACLVRDISELHQAREELEQLAHHDQLTGLPNRTVLDSLLERGVARARRGQHRLAVMFIDLDNFKEVNDTLGHAAGDAVLREASARMTSLLRDSDALARVGGDEFVAILDDLADTRSASTVAGKIMERLAAPLILDGHEVLLSCSIGISIFPDDATDHSRLLSHADTAMYRAKTQGRNDWRFYTPDMTASAMRYARLVEALRAALAGDALRQLYHPLIDLASGACVAFEALARWHDPELGDIEPAEFIPIAEQAGLIREVDLWALRSACERMRDWLDEGIAPDYISVNFSEASLSHPSFRDEIARTLELMDISASRLQLEITERLIMHRDEAIFASLENLAALGVRLAVDNFGRGYAALGQLRSLPLKTLKIDGSFIRSINPESEDDVIIADTLIAMGRALRMSLVAGGIEDMHQADFVRLRHGVLGQGFYFGQPLTEEDAGMLMRESRSVPALPRTATPS